MYVLAECGLIHKYLLKKEDIKRIETFFTITIVKDLSGYEVVKSENKITLSNGSETLVFKKSERTMWDFVYYLDEYSLGGPSECRTDMIENKKEIAQEVPVQEQLNKEEMECIYRHLKMFVQSNWSNKKNVPDACIGCGHYCSKDTKTFNPWPTFYKLSDLIKSTNEAHREPLSKQDSDPIHL